MILRSGHSYPIDYYALGTLLFELVTGLPPFYTKNPTQIQESILSNPVCFPSHVDLSEEIKDLLRRLLEKSEKFRLGSYAGVK